MTKTNEDTGASDLDALERLAELKQKGILTEDEFNAKKRELLNRSSTATVKTKGKMSTLRKFLIVGISLVVAFLAFATYLAKYGVSIDSPPQELLDARLVLAAPKLLIASEAKLSKFLQDFSSRRLSDGTSPTLIGWNRKGRLYTATYMVEGKEVALGFKFLERSMENEYKFMFILTVDFLFVTGEKGVVLISVRREGEELPPHLYALKYWIEEPAVAVPTTIVPAPIAPAIVQSKPANEEITRYKTRFGDVSVVLTDPDLSNSRGFKLQVAGKDVKDNRGHLVSNDNMHLVKQATLPLYEVVILNESCSGSTCSESGTFRVFVLSSGGIAISDSIEPRGEPDEIHSEGDAISVKFGSAGAVRFANGKFIIPDKLK